MYNLASILSVTLQTLPKAMSADSLSAGVEGVRRTQSMSYSSWIGIDILLVTALLFILVYRERQYLLFRLREFFSSDNRFFFTKSYTGSNKTGVLTVLTLIMCNALGLIVSGIANLYPHLFNLISPESIYDSSGLVLAMRVMGMVLLFVVVKGAIYWLVNWVFFRVDANIKWIQAYFFMTAAYSFVLFPFSIIELFVGMSEKLLTICLIILFISYEILLFYKLIVNFKANKYGFLLIFLYFCSVELLPALFVWKNLH